MCGGGARILSLRSVYEEVAALTQGNVIFADRQADSQTGTIRMVASVPNPGNILRPGQFGRIRALTAMRRAALLVPERAASELQGRYQIATVDMNNKVSIRGVQVGGSRGAPR
jgi:membrane fusion protein (multidrug efflux system)